jgi:hypothetical protein
MRRHTRTVAAAVALMMLTAWTPAAWAYRDWDETPLEVDALVLRPLGLAATIISGIGFFFLVLPWAALTDTVDEAAERVVMRPYRFTFERPLGFPTYSYEESGW